MFNVVWLIRIWKTEYFSELIFPPEFQIYFYNCATILEQASGAFDLIKVERQNLGTLRTRPGCIACCIHANIRHTLN